MLQSTKTSLFGASLAGGVGEVGVSVGEVVGASVGGSVGIGVGEGVVAST